MPKTLLLADDSVVIQKLVGLSFANEDVELITVDNGDDAIERARSTRPDLVLADVVMPGCSGYDVCEAVKKTPELAHTPVLLLTGTFEAFDEERASSVGSDGHITKPFEAQALVERVKTVLANAPGASGDSAAGDSGADAPTELAIGSNDSFDFFDDATDAPVTASPQADPGATVLVDDLFDGSQASPAAATATTPDPELSIPDIAPPTADEMGFQTPFADVDLLGNDGTPGPDDTTPELDTGDASGPLDLELSVGDMDSGAPPPLLASTEASAGAPTASPDATVALMPSDDPFAPAAGITADDSRAPLAESGPRAVTPDTDRFDISSSDLDDAMSVRAESVSPEPTTSAPAGPGSVTADSMITEPIFPPQTETAPSALGTPDEPIAVVQPIDEPFADPAGPIDAPATPAVDASPAESAIAAVLAAGDPTTSTAPSVSTTPPSAGLASGDGPAIDDEMRRQMQEALEKVAWEAFGDLSQTIVRQTIEQVERIAWEVVPQLAERLIQEEIRKLKGDS